MQFAKTVPEGVIKVDLLVGPLGDYATKVRLDACRAKPPSSVGLHARRVDEALGIDTQPMSIPLAGRLLSGEPHTTRVLVPSTFPYALMKLMAFRDRVDDVDKNLGRYHAVDLYRIVGMATEAEIERARALSRDYARDPALGEARALVERYFRPESGLGRIRIREYGSETRRLDLDRFVADFLYVLGVGS